MRLIHTTECKYDRSRWQGRPAQSAALHGTGATPQCSTLLDTVIASRTAITYMVDLCPSYAEGLVMNETSEALITKVNRANIRKSELIYSIETTVIMDLMIFDFLGERHSPTSHVVLM